MTERIRTIIRQEKEKSKQRKERRKRLTKAREEKERKKRQGGGGPSPKFPIQSHQPKKEGPTDRSPSVLAQEEPGGGYSLTIVDPGLLRAVQRSLQQNTGEIINSRSMHLHNGQTLVSRAANGSPAPIDQLNIRRVRRELEALAPDGTSPSWRIRMRLNTRKRHQALNR